ncbi:MAG TPA: SPOR domain-containing protein [Bacteroidota bacterium]|nr:SPOR domain-containing protein [Bacteroidota bacterium]
MKFLCLAFVLAVAAPGLQAQSADAEVTKYLTMLQDGQVDQVRAEIPALLARYPNNPGVLYIQAQTTSEGAEAVRIYQSIVDNFPASSWAPEALFKVYQFYYALGLYRTAEMKMAQLKKNYPASKRAAGGGEVDTGRLPEDKPALVPSGTSPGSDTSGSATAHFTLQVGAYTTQANAEKQKSFFEGLGYTVGMINRVKDNRSLFLVLVGTYPSAEAAKAQAAEIKAKFHIDSIVITN